MPVGMPSIDVEAVQVKKYAQENPNEDLEPEPPAQAGQMHLAPADPQSMMPEAPHAEGQKRLEPEDLEQQGDAKKLRIGEEQPVTPPDDTMDNAGERAPKTPRLTDSPKQQRMNQVTSTDLDLYEHEDSAVQFQFDNDDLDRLEQYEMKFYDDEFLVSDDSEANDDCEMARILQELTFPYSLKEPDVTAAELTRLDALADQLELKRLESG